MQPVRITYQNGLSEALRQEAAALYNQAFGAKLGVAIPAEADRLALLESWLNPDYAIVAVAGDKLVGIAGYHTPEGSFTAGRQSGGQAFRQLVFRLGWIRGTWATAILNLYSREPAPGELLMDGLAVRTDFRRQGIGGRLLDAICDTARAYQFGQVRLDVIDSNPRARVLYERKGFKAVRSDQFPYLRWLLGFGGSTTMILQIQ